MYTHNTDLIPLNRFRSYYNLVHNLVEGVAQNGNLITQLIKKSQRPVLADFRPIFRVTV